MGADIAANPHYPVLPHALRLTSSRSAFLAISGPQNGALRRTPEQSGDGLVGPLSGAGLTLKALRHPVCASAEAVAVQATVCFPVPDRVRLNSWESRRSVIELSVNFLVNRPVLFWLVLQPPFVSRRSDVSVVR